MVNLSIRVFDSYTLQDILGESPEADEKLRAKLENETTSLIHNLQSKSNSELQDILSQHILAKQIGRAHV